MAELERGGYHLRAPGQAQWDTPTSRPRRRGASGRQIDGVATKGTRHPQVEICENSYRQIGGDHDRLRVVLPLAGIGPPDQTLDTRPRVLAADIPPQPGLNQTRVEQLAAQYTKPYPDRRYRDPQAVQKAFREARLQNTESAWKTAQLARRKARDDWHHAKVLRAVQGGWQDMRELRAREGTEWAVHLQKQDPLSWTAKHFADLFKQAAEQAEVRWPQADGNPFQLEELRAVLQKGKRRKAVGLDGTSYEFLKGLCQDQMSEQSLLMWLESVCMGAPIPEAWLTTIITLLPKKDKPGSPSDLRPISLSSAVGKVFGGLLLGRTRMVLAPQGPEQYALCGRQTADYLFAVFRTFALETEWKLGLHWLKIDINKAYDSIHRGKILEFLETHLPQEMYREFEAWKRLLGPGKGLLRTPWGNKAIDQTRGIRQGAVESPFIFAIAMECALHQAQKHPEWPQRIPAAPDLPLTSLLFMDDSILWDSSRDQLVVKFRLFSRALGEWGLTVNPRKTTLYSSPYATETGTVALGEVALKPSHVMEVMGVQLKVPLKPAAIMDTGMAKARKKYFASRHILEWPKPSQKEVAGLPSNSRRGCPMVLGGGDTHGSSYGGVEHHAVGDGGQNVPP